MASAMGKLIDDIRKAVIDAAQHSDAIGDLPLRHKAQLSTMARLIRGNDHFDGGSGGGSPDMPRHKPGDGSSDSPNIPHGVRPYKGPNRNKDKGEYGEDVTDAYMHDRGYERISHREGPNGIDGIYANIEGDVVIVEAKYNTSKLGWAKNEDGERVRQMDDEWLTGKFHNHTENRIRDAINDDDLADAVAELFEGGNVPPIVARVMPDGSVEMTMPRFNPDGSIAEHIPLDF